MSCTLSEEPGTTTYGTPRPRVFCWIEEHDSHGLMYNAIVWLPEGDKPEIGRWIRAPWLDEPVRSRDIVFNEATKPPEGWNDAKRLGQYVWERKLKEHNIKPTVTDAYTDGFYDGAAWGRSLDAIPGSQRLPVVSCRDCPFTGESSGEAVTCEHPKCGKIPFGHCEDSWTDRTAPPAGCPLRFGSAVVMLDLSSTPK